MMLVIHLTWNDRKASQVQGVEEAGSSGGAKEKDKETPVAWLMGRFSRALALCPAHSLCPPKPASHPLLLCSMGNCCGRAEV